MAQYVREEFEDLLGKNPANLSHVNRVMKELTEEIDQLKEQVAQLKADEPDDETTVQAMRQLFDDHLEERQLAYELGVKMQEMAEWLKENDPKVSDDRAVEIARAVAQEWSRTGDWDGAVHSVLEVIGYSFEEAQEVADEVEEEAEKEVADEGEKPKGKRKSVSERLNEELGKGAA